MKRSNTNKSTSIKNNPLEKAWTVLAVAGLGFSGALVGCEDSLSPNTTLSELLNQGSVTVELQYIVDEDEPSVLLSRTFLDVKPRALELRLRFDTRGLSEAALEELQSSGTVLAVMHPSQFPGFRVRSRDLENINSLQVLDRVEFVDFMENSDGFNSICGDSVARTYGKLDINGELVNTQFSFQDPLLWGGGSEVGMVSSPILEASSDCSMTYTGLLSGGTCNKKDRCDLNVQCPVSRAVTTCFSASVGGSGSVGGSLSGVVTPAGPIPTGGEVRGGGKVKGRLGSSYVRTDVTAGRFCEGQCKVDKRYDLGIDWLDADECLCHVNATECCAAPSCIKGTTPCDNPKSACGG